MRRMMRSVAGVAIAAGLAMAGTACAETVQGHGRPTTAESRSYIHDYARLLFREHKPLDAWKRYFSAHLIQHNPEIGDGGDADVVFLEGRRKAHPEEYLGIDRYASVVDNLLADGDLVVAKTRVFTSEVDKGRTFIDMWRVNDGQFVEHWDIIQATPDAPLNDATMGCGHVANYADALKAADSVFHPTCGEPGPASHRAASLAVVRAYLALSDRKGGAAAVRRYIADDFVQHSPHIAQGKAALIAYFEKNAAERAKAGRHSETARMLADGDFVLLHRRVTTREDPRGIVYADLFKVRNGKIAEHWDVIQPIPPTSLAGHGMTAMPLEPGRTVGAPPV